MVRCGIVRWPSCSIRYGVLIRVTQVMTTTARQAQTSSEPHKLHSPWSRGMPAQMPVKFGRLWLPILNLAGVCCCQRWH